jgi:hypothetical protein
VSIRADNRLDDAPMVPVDCRRCAATVLVRKSSWAQTSVQWNADALAECAERREAGKLVRYGGRDLFLACLALREAIVDAARLGSLPVVGEASPVEVNN